MRDTVHLRTIWCICLCVTVNLCAISRLLEHLVLSVILERDRVVWGVLALLLSLALVCRE